MRRGRFPSYEQKFLKFSKSIEKWIMAAIILLFLSLAITQGLLHIESFRALIVDVERLEGVAS